MFNHMNKKKITLFLSISTIITLFLGELFARYILGLGDPPHYEERKKPDNLYRDFIHPNEKGQQLLAQGILEELKTLSWYGDQ
jgi:lysophospholipase L1-like esterase